MVAKRPRHQKEERQGKKQPMDSDERPRDTKMTWGPRRKRNVETHGEEGTQENRLQGRKAIKSNERYIKNKEGRNMVERGEGAQSERALSRQPKPVGRDLGAAARAVAHKNAVDSAVSEGEDDHARGEEESKHDAARPRRNVEKLKRKRLERRYRAQQKNFEAREAKRKERAQLEKAASALQEQKEMNVGATTGLGAEKDQEATDEDDFDIDIYGDEETRRKYGKRMRVA